MTQGTNISDFDRRLLETVLRGWEQSQLHTHQLSIHQTVDVMSLTKRLSSFSFSDVRQRRRFSLTSMAGSLQTFRSEPHGTGPNARAKIGDLEQQLLKTSLAQPSGFIRQNANRLKALDRTKDYLLSAIACGDLGSVSFVLEPGADVEKIFQYPDEACMNALMLASRYGHSEIVSSLLSHGANCDASNINRQTPLHIASAHGHAEVVAYLLENGANASISDCTGRTALHNAAAIGSVEIVR